MAKKHTNKNNRPVLGTFSKGIDGSVSLNFDVSGGRNCSTACALHPESTNPAQPEDDGVLCYAVRTEIRPDRTQLKDKLARHSMLKAYRVCGQAIIELQDRIKRGKRTPWLRISTNGSVPNRKHATALFRSQFRALLSICRDNGIPVHFPCEDPRKVEFYRELCGDLVTVRESYTVESDEFVRADGAASATAGTRKQNRAQRVEAARQLAAARRTESDRKVIVCPAITNSWASNPVRNNPIPSNPRAKCGACVACAQAHVDVVYPLH